MWGGGVVSLLLIDGRGVVGVVVVGVSSPTQVVVESGLRLVVCGVVV